VLSRHHRELVLVASGPTVLPGRASNKRSMVIATAAIAAVLIALVAALVFGLGGERNTSSAAGSPDLDSLKLAAVRVEVDFGDGEGLTAAEMHARFPAERAAFDAAPASTPLPGGESGVSAVERALPVVCEAITTPGVTTVLFVIHSTLGRLLLCEFLGIDKDRYRSVFPQFINGAITTVSFDAPHTIDDLRGKGALIRFNSSPGAH
jgi:broad specificity phosphatase PhoE